MPIASRLIHALQGYRIKGARLIGRSTSDGPPEEIALGSGLQLTADNVMNVAGVGGLVGNGPPDGNTSHDGIPAESAAIGTTWLDDDADIVYFKKLNGTWTLGSGV